LKVTVARKLYKVDIRLISKEKNQIKKEAAGKEL
jgi:hypothetical protein